MCKSLWINVCSLRWANVDTKDSDYFFLHKGYHTPELKMVDQSLLKTRVDDFKTDFMSKNFYLFPKRCFGDDALNLIFYKISIARVYVEALSYQLNS